MPSLSAGAGLMNTTAMAHELGSVLLQGAREKALDGRWPVSYAIRVITGVSAALWAMIIVAASWLIG